MYSPKISQHTKRMYQLGQHYGIPMTEVADRLLRQEGLAIAFGLRQRLLIAAPQNALQAAFAVLEKVGDRDSQRIWPASATRTIWPRIAVWQKRRCACFRG